MATRRVPHLQAALNNENAAQNAVERTLKRGWPLNSPVEWRRGPGGIHFGHVIAHGYGAHIRVLNEKTGREVWITAFDICEASSTAQE
jgi:hypothetical protein